MILAMAVGLLLSSKLIPIHRVQAYYWHVVHGTSIEFAGYRLPVPREWFVERQSPTDLMLIDLKTGDSISVTPVPWVKQPLTSWVQAISRPTRDGMTKILGQREIEISNEAVVCLEQDVNLKQMHLYPIQCRSARGLEIRFTPQPVSGRKNVQKFYSLMQQIRKL